MGNKDFDKSKEWDVSSAALMKAHGYAADANHASAFEEAHKQEELALEILGLAQRQMEIAEQVDKLNWEI